MVATVCRIRNLLSYFYSGGSPSVFDGGTPELFEGGNSRGSVQWASVGRGRSRMSRGRRGSTQQPSQVNVQTPSVPSAECRMAEGRVPDDLARARARARARAA